MIEKAATSLSGSFWFVPALMISVALIIAYYLPTIQVADIGPFLIKNRLGVSSPATAMQIVQTIASSVITITSIAFSMTIVALVMASSQFGPRLIKNFMQSKSTQMVLGTFTSTFVFCLVLISQINVGEHVAYFPELSVFFAIILAIICIFVLIFFIHHVATSIRADTVVKQIASSLMFDMQVLQNKQHKVIEYPHLFNLDSFTYQQDIVCACNGYIQAIEHQYIADLAESNSGVIVLNYRAGDYIVPHTPVATLHSNQNLPRELNIDEAMVIGQERTALQDPLFAINQLVEMALRALSPSLNDPFTATSCIDRLASALATFTPATLPKNTILNAEGELRIITKDLRFEDLFAGAFTQIRQASSQNVYVLFHILDTFITLLQARNEQHMVRAIAFQVQCIQESTDKQSPFHTKTDLQAYQNRIDLIKSLLK